MPDPAPGGPPEMPPARPLPIAALAAAILVVVVLAASGGLLAAGDGPAAPPATMVAPEGVLDLATVPDAVAVEFRSAAEHADHFRGFRCWCGCEAAFDHRSLADCFVRPDGRWEAHGAGCAICLAEARIAREALEAGTAPDRIAAVLDARFGPDPTLSTGKATKDA